MTDGGVGLGGIFEMQHRASRAEVSGFEVRMDRLRRVERVLTGGRRELIEAVSADFGGRSPEETQALELLPLLSELRHARSNLHGWMEKRKAPLGPLWWPARGEVRYQPLGVVGIVGAWNYPLLLALAPAVGALAAGNRVLIKPSEGAPKTAELLRTLIAEEFRPEELRVVTGGAEVSQEFAALPFDHLLFTGSERVGRMVLRAASENLTPVTLELGGKSPALIHESYPLRKAAERIMAGKLYNAGQTCVAPDYVLVPATRRDEFLREAERAAARLYPRLRDNPDYTRIASSKHFERLRAMVAEARQLGAEVREINPAGEELPAELRVMAPALIWNAGEITRVMREEIFGPILAVVSYEHLDEALDYINSAPRPLALYYFDHKSSRINHVLDRTVSGGAAINDCVLQAGHPELPFGGVGASGMGQYHGFDSFRTFSKKKAVLRQGRWAATSLIHPPYTAWKQRLIAWLSR